MEIAVILKNIIGSFKRIGKVLKERLYFGLQEVMTASYSQIGIFIIFYFMVEDEYSAYRKLFIIIAPIYLLSVTFSQVLLHHLKKYEGTSIIPEFRKYQKYTLYGAVVLTACLFLGKTLIIELLGKMEATPEISMLFSFVIMVSFMRFVLGNYEMVLVRIDQQQKRFYIMFVAVLVNIASIILLVPKYHLMGAVLTDVITNVIVLLGLIMVAEREMRKFQLKEKKSIKI